MFLKMPQNSQENTCVGVSFLMTLQGSLQLYFLKRKIGSYLWILQHSYEQFFIELHHGCFSEISNLPLAWHKWHVRSRELELVPPRAAVKIFPKVQAFLLSEAFFLLSQFFFLIFEVCNFVDSSPLCIDEKILPSI